MSKIGTIYYLREDSRKNLKVIREDGDKIGLIPNIICELDGQMYLTPSLQIIWAEEKEVLKLYKKEE